jgi:hypothetical protein
MIANLPVDVWTVIACHLDTESVLRLAHVCQRLRRMVRTSPAIMRLESIFINDVWTYFRTQCARCGDTGVQGEPGRMILICCRCKSKKIKLK